MGIEFPANGLSEVVDGAMVSLSINVQISDGLHSAELSHTKKWLLKQSYVPKSSANKQFKMTQR